MNTNQLKDRVKTFRVSFGYWTMTAVWPPPGINRPPGLLEIEPGGPEALEGREVADDREDG